MNKPKHQEEKKFDPTHLAKLNNPDRLKVIPPSYLWDKLNLMSAKTIVEIGAGTAFFSIAIIPYAKPSVIYACDISDKMVNWIKENVSPNYPEIVPIKTEEHSIPLNSGIADLVFMINLHHELEEALLTLKEANRLLKPGATLLIVDWKKKDMKEGPPLNIRCEPDCVKKQLKDAGFTDIELFDDIPTHFVLVARKTP